MTGCCEQKNYKWISLVKWHPAVLDASVRIGKTGMQNALNGFHLFDIY